MRLRDVAAVNRRRGDDDLELLARLTDGEYDPEPPRRNVLVDVIAALAERKGGALVTPHQTGGMPEERLQYEYDGALAFWEWIADYISVDVFKEKRVLDIGCGWGGKAIYWMEHLGPAFVVGFDLSSLLDPAVPTRVAAERGLTNISFLTADAAAMPFEDAEFDIAIMDDVLEHVADPARVLGEAYRVIRPTGLLIAKFPSFKMMREHHLDRAIPYRGAHYLLPIRVWAAGLNDRLLRKTQLHYRPFAKVTRTPFHPAITSNLNGMSFRDFTRLIAATKFDVKELRMLGLAPDRMNPRPKHVRAAYEAVRSAPWLREFLSRGVLVVAQRPPR
jgi:2-polyprenyl-3-methyl-5-hydroxy-6-metoxy-1,4-benzoquinol methylase